MARVEQYKFRQIFKQTEPPNEGRLVPMRIRTLRQTTRTDWVEIMRVLGEEFLPSFNFDQWVEGIMGAAEWAFGNEENFRKLQLAGFGYDTKDKNFIPFSSLPEQVQPYVGELSYLIGSWELIESDKAVGFCPGTEDFRREVIVCGEKGYRGFDPGGKKRLPYENKDYDPEIASETRMIDLARKFLNGEGGWVGGGYILGYMYFRYCAELSGKGRA